MVPFSSMFIFLNIFFSSVVSDASLSDMLPIVNRFAHAIPLPGFGTLVVILFSRQKLQLYYFYAGCFQQIKNCLLPYHLFAIAKARRCSAASIIVASLEVDVASCQELSAHLIGFCMYFHICHRSCYQRLLRLSWLQLIPQGKGFLLTLRICTL